MANKKKDIDKLSDIAAKSEILTYGTDGTLKQEDSALSGIITSTIIATKDKFGMRTSGKPINYFNELNIGNAFAEMSENIKDKKKKKDSDENTGNKFKKYMSENEMVDASSLLLADQGRLINFANYNTIYNHIPECAQALDIYKDNIMSPDDFTKMIFDVSYDTSNTKLKEIIEKQLSDITSHYEIETKADTIIGETLKYGEYYVAVLSLENELDAMLGDTRYTGMNNGSFFNKATGALNESVLALDRDYISTVINSDTISLTEQDTSAFRELLNEENLSEAEVAKYIAETVNNNVQIGSKTEFLVERLQANYDFGSENGYDLSDIPGASLNTVKKKGGKNAADKKPLYINGSVIKMLKPERVCELKVDNVCYGYYYVEDASTNSIANASYLGVSSGREARMGTGVNMGLNNNAPGTSKYNPSTSAASMLGVSEQKLKLVSDIFINQLATKVDKNFIRKNKKFKEFIYELIKQDYIIKKGVKMTYFGPDEVVKFELQPIYSKIVFAAKMYLSTMTNDILVKLGRAHDKRVFYVNTGLDANYEQAINKVIDDIKRREYKMDNLNDFNSILNLNPGRWDDYFIPTVNGDRPIEIDTLAGMDTDLNSEFLQYLKSTMLSGMSVPTNLIESINDVNFARTLSAQNANFVRNIIRYQKLLTIPFSRLYQLLYKNEYRYANDKETDIDKKIDIEQIKCHFPSPASLNMSNMTEQIQSVDANAEFISSQILPPTQDGSTENTRIKLKSEIVKDLMPGVDWEKYAKIKDDLMLQSKKDQILAPQPQQDGQDPYAGNITY